MKINNKIKTFEILGCNDTGNCQKNSKEFKGKFKSDEQMEVIRKVNFYVLKVH